MTLSRAGISNYITTNGSAPGAITPWASTAVGDLLIFYHHSAGTGGNETVTPGGAGWTLIKSNVSATGGLIAAYWKIRASGDTTYTATVTNHSSGSSGESIIEFIETWTGHDPDTPILSASATVAVWAASASLGPINAPAAPAVDPGNAAVVFAGRHDEIITQTQLTGDSLTWAVQVTQDNTSGADNGVATQTGFNGTGSSVNVTSKTISATGTTDTGSGFMFVVQQHQAATQSGDVSAPVSAAVTAEGGKVQAGTAAAPVSAGVTAGAGREAPGQAVAALGFGVTAEGPSGQIVEGQVSIGGAGLLATILAFGDPQIDGNGNETWNRAHNVALLAADTAADLVMDTGDDTNSGEWNYFQTAVGGVSGSQGALLARIRSVIGGHDHDYAWPAYYSGDGATWAGWGTAAGPDSDHCYFSFDLGGWHIIVLDDEDTATSGVTDTPSGHPGHRIPTNSGGSPENPTAQYAWLASDLAANPGKPVIVFTHQGRYSRMGQHPTTALAVNDPYWALLISHGGVEVAVSGHSHDFERWARMAAGGTTADPVNGIRQIRIPPAQERTQAPDTSPPQPEAYIDCNDNPFGLLRLRLYADHWTWDFLAPSTSGVSSYTLVTDSGSQASKVALPGGGIQAAITAAGSAAVGSGATTALGFGCTATGDVPGTGTPASVRSASSYGTATAAEASCQVALPSGWQAGDVCYAAVDFRGTNGVLTAPAGWATVLPSVNSAGAASSRMAVYRRVMQSGDSSPVTFTNDVAYAGRWGVVIACVKDADGTTPEDGVTPVYSSPAAGPSPLAVTAGGITPNGSNDLLLCMWGSGDATASGTMSYGTPAGMTIAAQGCSTVSGSTEASAMIASQQLASNAPTGTRSSTITSSPAGQTLDPQSLAVVVKSAGGGAQTRSGDVTAALAGTVTAGAQAVHEGGATAPASAAVTAGAQAVHAGGASVPVSAAVTAEGTTGTPPKTGDVTVPVSAVISAGGGRSAPGDATVPVSAPVTAGGGREAPGSVTVPVSAAVTAAGARIAPEGASAPESFTVTAEGTVTRPGSATAAGTVTVTAGATAEHAGSAIVTGTAAVTAEATTGAPPKTGQVSAPLAVTITSGGLGTHPGGAAVPGQATVTAEGTGTHPGGASVPASAVITAAGERVRTGSVAVPASATVTVSGLPARPGEAAAPVLATVSAGALASYAADQVTGLGVLVTAEAAISYLFAGLTRAVRAGGPHARYAAGEAHARWSAGEPHS